MASATWSGLSTGQPLSCGEEKLSVEQRDGRGEANCQPHQRGDGGPGLETKIIKPRRGGLGKATEKVPPGTHQLWAFAE